MKKLYFIAVFCCLYIFIGCKSKEKTNKSAERASDEKETSDSISRKRVIKDIIIDNGFSAENKNNRMSILAASVNKDILELIINYSGGCKEHVFNLYSTGFYAKSLPPQMHLDLIDSQNEDACRQLITDTLSFKLYNIKIENTNKVILTINEYEEKIAYIY